jgi:hypothetical protein
MTDGPTESHRSGFDPGSMPTSSFTTAKLVWYRRPWFLVAAGVALVVGVSVITDLPHHISRAQDAGDQTSAMHQINYDLKTCDFSVTEAFKFYRLNVAKKLTPSEFHLVNDTYLQQDRVSCSFATGPLSDMTGNLQIVDTTAGKQVEKVRLAVVRWINHDARTAIEDIITLFAHPGDAKALHDLAVEEDYMAQDRQSALGYLSNAEAALGQSLPGLNLPVLARLPGT